MIADLFIERAEAAAAQVHAAPDEAAAEREIETIRAAKGAGGVGGLLAVSRNGQFYFPTYDNNGNVTKYIDEYGNIVAAYEYDDFGHIISQSGPLADFFRHRFSTKYYASVMNLKEYMAESIGKEFVGVISDAWQN